MFVSGEGGVSRSRAVNRGPAHPRANCLRDAPPSRKSARRGGGSTGRPTMTAAAARPPRAIVRGSLEALNPRFSHGSLNPGTDTPPKVRFALARRQRNDSQPGKSSDPKARPGARVSNAVELISRFPIRGFSIPLVQPAPSSARENQRVSRGIATCPSRLLECLLTASGVDAWSSPREPYTVS